MGKLMVGLTRFLPLCAVLLVLPAIASAQCPSPFSVQRFWTHGAGGPNQTTFGPGKTIQFVAQLNNHYGSYILAANGIWLTITTGFYTHSRPADIPS
jgi:hypothetical protein